MTQNPAYTKYNKTRLLLKVAKNAWPLGRYLDGLSRIVVRWMTHMGKLGKYYGNSEHIDLAHTLFWHNFDNETDAFIYLILYNDIYGSSNVLLQLFLESYAQYWT